MNIERNMNYANKDIKQSIYKMVTTQGALKILSDSNQTKDKLFISETANSFSKEQVIALLDNCENVDISQLQFYFQNCNNTSAILNAINFSDGVVECGYNPAFKDFGTISFFYNGSKQVIPNYAVSKMNAKNFPNILAKNNVLILNNKSYYCYRAKNGGYYTWTVNDGRVGWASSESLLSENTNRRGNNYKWEMRQASNILSDLAKGTSLYGYERENVKKVLSEFGISEGHFVIDAGAGTHHYILCKNGNVIDVDDEIKQMNEMNWKDRGYQEGDVFNVYGKEYMVDNDGYIHIDVDDGFTSTNIKYPQKLDIINENIC